MTMPILSLQPPWRRLQRSLLTASVAVLAGGVLSGCSLFVREGPPEPRSLVKNLVLSDWATPAAGEPVVDDWIKEFNDPTLESLVEEAWANNATLLSAISQRDASAARAALDKAANLPHLDGQASVGRQRQINDFLGNSTLLPQDSYISRIRFGLGLSWELDVWDRVLDLDHAAASDVSSAILDVEAARFSLAAQTATLWFNLVAADQRLAMYEKLRKSQTETVRIARERELSGLTSTAELIKLETDLSISESDLIQRRLERGRTARLLEVLLGRYPAASVASTQSLPAIPAPVAAGLPSSLLERRPDLQAAALRVTSGDFRLLAAKKNLLPRFTLNASGGTQSKYRDLLFDTDSMVWSLGGGLVQPIFDGGFIRANIRVQRALMKDLMQKYREKALNAFREVEDGLATEGALREEREHIQHALELSQRNQSLAGQSFERGALDSGSNLAAQRGLVLSQLRAMELDLALLNNRIALDLALGGSPIVHNTPGDHGRSDVAPPPAEVVPVVTPGTETAPATVPTSLSTPGLLANPSTESSRDDAPSLAPSAWLSTTLTLAADGTAAGSNDRSGTTADLTPISSDATAARNP